MTMSRPAWLALSLILALPAAAQGRFADVEMKLTHVAGSALQRGRPSLPSVWSAASIISTSMFQSLASSSWSRS